MKIALCNRDPSGHLGGDVIQVNAYIDALRELGHEATYCGTLYPDLRGYDEAWLFHINMGWTFRQWQKVCEAGIPYRVFAIYYPWVYSDINQDQMRTILNGAKAIYCLSTTEEAELKAEFPDVHVTVINNGANKAIFNPEGEKIEGDYLISVGRIEPAKGHAFAVDVARELGMDAYVIGPVWDGTYKAQMNLSYDRAHILDPISQTELAKYYRGAKAYICGSAGERNSLTVLEAAACGVPVLNSMHNRGKEWLSAPIITFKDLPSIVEMTKEAIANPKDLSKEVPSWKDIVEQILKT
jgi:glycosyltransferase involved in cell wall biosynthesis